MLKSSIKMNVIHILIDQDRGYKSSSWDSFFGNTIGKFSNKYAFFVFWSIFITNVAFDVIFSWLVFEFFSNFLADTYHIGNIFLRINLDLFHWQLKSHTIGINEFYRN